MVGYEAAADAAERWKRRDSMTEPGQNLVSMRGITKTFLGVRANDAVSFDLRAGEIHTLLGENGAGKSTLMNVLCGLYAPEAGHIVVDGNPQVFRAPSDAIAAGIGMVHQHFLLVPVLTVWENMVLGDRAVPSVLPRRSICQRIEALAAQYGLAVDPGARIWQLSVGEQQRVAILRALYRGARVLILDEPTAVLTPQEAQALFGTLRRMATEGHGVVFISHKLDEVMAVSSRVTILRRGKTIGTWTTAETSKAALAEHMVGHRVAISENEQPRRGGENILEAQELMVRSDRNLPAVRHLSLALRRGEILGLAGVAGNGQRELCEALVGIRPLEGGSMVLKGRQMTGASPRAFQREGVAYIPADRMGMGLVGSMNLRENVALRRYWRPVFSRWKLFLDWEIMAGCTGALVERFRIQAASLGVAVRTLSGGNLQKLMLARELDDDPDVVVAQEPTWGLDIGATQYVRERLLEARNRGAAVLLVSEDLEEVLALSDRLAVMHQGALMGISENPRALGVERIGLMMAGTPLGTEEGGAYA